MKPHDIAYIKKHAKNVFKAINDKDSEVVLLHQDAFAIDYQENEIKLLGLVIKYAGLFGKEVRIIGTNKETQKQE